MKARAIALALLTACAGEQAPWIAPYRAVPNVSAGRIDGRLAVGDSIDPQDIVVWLDDVRTGKPQPLPRRYQLDHERGKFSPRVQAAFVGGALLVRSLDATHFRVSFRRDAASDSVIASVEETGPGQVVPTARPLTREGIISAVTNEQRPARAWMLVFEQPYFAEPDSAGRFAMDSVPAGTWRMRAWHPRLGLRDTLVRVDSARVSFADVSY